MKEKLTALDIELVTSELNHKLVNHRLSNIYNIAESNRQFLLKFNKPDSKFNVVVSCGLKVHITDFTRPTPPQPNGFVVKLRNYLKSRRLTGVKQVEKDRVIVFEFSDGAFYLVLEFFSAGNVFLLDSERRILVLQRVVEEHENKIGSLYSMFDETLFKKPDLDAAKTETYPFSEEIIKTWINEEAQKFAAQKIALAENTTKNKKLKILSINKLLFLKAPYLSSPMIAKYLMESEIDCNKPCLDFIDQTQLLNSALQQSFAEYNALLNTPIDQRVGYITSKKNGLYRTGVDDETFEYIYDKFEPFPPCKTDDATEKIEKIENGYNSTIDKFFSTIESSKYALKIAAHEQQAAKKIESTKTENEQRLKQFEELQTLNEQKGNTIIHYSDLVESCKNAVQGLIDQQMDWESIEKLIKSEQLKKNEIASLIKLPLDLKNNKIKVILPLPDYYAESEDDNSSDSDSSSDSDDDSNEARGKPFLSSSKTKKGKQQNSVTVVIDLSLSAHANASNYFSIKKQTQEKQMKTEKNQKMALKNITERINKNLQGKLKEQHDTLKKIRSQYFFEKYFWFISTEGYLVLMGKSDQETDLIYSKYISDEDFYVTNDIGGKFTQVFIKNPNKDKELPPNTLMQASIFSVSGSDAWNKKLQSLGTWVTSCKNISKFHPNDKTKKTPLEFGKFHIYDENLKTHLPPVQMVMGLAFLWKVKTDHDGVYVEEEGEEGAETIAAVEAAGIEEPAQLATESEKIIAAVSLDDVKDELATVEVDNDDNEDANESLAAETGEDSDDAQSVSLATDIVVNMNKNVRGKKGKLKKIQRKYRDQDEDERLLRLDLLGTLKGVNKEQEKDQEQLAREQKRLEMQERRKQRVEKQAMRFTEAGKPVVHYDKIFQELKGTCDASDEILELVPVFAPWSALTKYKCKIKVQPGNNKKLKSCNEILNYYGKCKVDIDCKDKEMLWPREKELIQTLKDQELAPLFCVDKIKINIPNAGTNSNNKKGSSFGDKKQKKKKK